MTKPVRIRNLKSGERFILCRTGEKYTFERSEFRTPGGIRYVVKKDGESRESTLHHSCHVERLSGMGMFL